MSVLLGQLPVLICQLLAFRSSSFQVLLHHLHPAYEGGDGILWRITLYTQQFQLFGFELQRGVGELMRPLCVVIAATGHNNDQENNHQYSRNQDFQEAVAFQCHGHLNPPYRQAGCEEGAGALPGNPG